MRVPVAYPQAPQLRWFEFQGQDLEEPGCVFSGTITCHPGGDGPVPAAQCPSDARIRGLHPACACLEPPLLGTHVPSLKALPCICGMVLQHAADVLVLHQPPVSLF